MSALATLGRLACWFRIHTWATIEGGGERNVLQACLYCPRVRLIDCWRGEITLECDDPKRKKEPAP